MQIKRVRGAQRDEFALCRRFPNGTQQANSFGQGELFAADPRYEIAAANLAARFPPAINSPQLVPGNWETLALKQTAVANVLIFQAAAPLVAAILAWLWLGERVSRGVIVL